jgi:hypothetical protein
MASITAMSADRMEALTNVKSTPAARSDLEKTFEYKPRESRARTVAAMSEVAEKALWEGHGKCLPESFGS